MNWGKSLIGFTYCQLSIFDRNLYIAPCVHAQQNQHLILSWYESKMQGFQSGSCYP